MFNISFLENYILVSEEHTAHCCDLHLYTWINIRGQISVLPWQPQVQQMTALFGGSSVLSVSELLIRLIRARAAFRKHFFKLTGLKVWLWKLGLFHFHKVTSFHCWVKRHCCFLKPTSPSFIFSVVSCAYPFLYCSPELSHSADEYFIPWALKREHTKHTGG